MALNVRNIATLHRLFGKCGIRAVTQAQNISTSSPLHNEEIVIPKRIQRSPTDILQALASTVNRDTNGPHYKYHDDPFLTPSSNLMKRSYSLSKEAGRKAARWIRDENPQLFNHMPEDPHIEAFAPKVQYNEESDVSEETLRELVRTQQVADVITVYQICKDKGIALSDPTLQEVLELVCYYNGEAGLEEEWMEERWYQQASTRTRKTWKDNGLAEEIFESLSERGSVAYCALIRGMAHYFQLDRAWKLYRECKEKDIALDTETYNSLIRVSSFQRDSHDLRWKLIKDLLTSMATGGIKPNQGTLNSTLEATNQLGNSRQAREQSLRIFGEFTSLGISPSLATYYYLMVIHCKERGPLCHILLDILDHIEGKQFEVQHMKDTFFFITAMDICRNHLKSLDAARRVDNLLNTGENYHLIGDSYKESIYYRHYFCLNCSVLPTEEMMELYSELVPHVYTPEPTVMEDIVKSLSVNLSLEYLPQLFSDIIIFGYTRNERLLSCVLATAAQHLPSEENGELTERILAIGLDIWKRIQEQDDTVRNRILWSGRMLGDLLTIVVQCGDYQHGRKVLSEATTQAHTIVGDLSSASLKVLLDAAIDRKDGATGVSVILYALDCGHLDTGDLARRLRTSLDLTADQRAKLTSALGTGLMEGAGESSDSDNDRKE